MDRAVPASQPACNETAALPKKRITRVSMWNLGPRMVSASVTLDRRISETLTSAWTRLLAVRTESQDGRPRWIDYERETGLMKDIDAVNCFLEPYLLNPSLVPKPPIEETELQTTIESLLHERDQMRNRLAKSAGDKAVESNFFGFYPVPYIQNDIPMDYVDCAGDFLTLACNALDFFSSTRKELSKSLLGLLKATVKDGVEYLALSAIKDMNGVRWALGRLTKSGKANEYANLFSTYWAAQGLSRVVRLEPKWKVVDSEALAGAGELLSLIPRWLESQYDTSSRRFWLDEGRSQSVPLAAIYAVRLALLCQNPLADGMKDVCNAALHEILDGKETTEQIGTLQDDFSYRFPNPYGPGSFFYDDRSYIGSLLSIIAEMTSKYPDMVDDELAHAGDRVLEGLSSTDDWRDESGLWDVGRPLICWTREALVGLVSYGLSGQTSPLILRETDFRMAISDALKSRFVIDAIIEEVKNKQRLTERQSDRDRLRSASTRHSSSGGG